MSTEELLENRRKQNAKNRIPDLRDDSFDISRIEIMGCPVLKLIHREKTDKANLFLIGGGMVSAPRPGSVKKSDPVFPVCKEGRECWEMMIRLAKKQGKRNQPDGGEI